MSMFDQDADEGVFPIPKKMPTNQELFISFRNQTANMMIEFQKKLLDDLTKIDNDKLLSENASLKRNYDELMKENGALSHQILKLQADIADLKQRRVKAPNENLAIWEHIVGGKPDKSVHRSKCIHFSMLLMMVSITTW